MTAAGPTTGRIRAAGRAMRRRWDLRRHWALRRGLPIRRVWAGTPLWLRLVAAVLALVALALGAAGV
ncbi:MAG TPA: hypothetical protein VF788_03035, partial [Pseudonocardiaceae bacterium]